MAEQLEAFDAKVQLLHDLHQNGEVGDAFLAEKMGGIVSRLPDLRVDLDSVRSVLRKWLGIGAITKEQLQITIETVLENTSRHQPVALNPIIRPVADCTMAQSSRGSSRTNTPDLRGLPTAKAPSALEHPTDEDLGDVLTLSEEQILDLSNCEVRAAVWMQLQRVVRNRVSC
jgi:hypothetical protein